VVKPEGMSDSGVRKFLDLVMKELGADDARAELFGRDPADPHVVFKNLAGGFRVVAVWDEVPSNRDALQLKLDRLAETFAHTLNEIGSVPPPRMSPTLPARRLDDALEALRARTFAVAVVLIDGNSPVLWGSSDATRDFVDVENLAKIGIALNVARVRGLSLDQLPLDDVSALLSTLRARGFDKLVIDLLSTLIHADDDESTARHRLLTALAIADVRARVHRGESVRSVHHETQYGYIARGFANIYQLIVVFAGPFSELHVESAVLHALPSIEELLFALPPVDPPPSKGQVIRLRRRS
jgi:hypothetical protein